MIADDLIRAREIVAAHKAKATIFDRDSACKAWLRETDNDLRVADVIAIVAIVCLLSFAAGYFS